MKEYKQYGAYNPSYTFSKPSASILRMMSNDQGFGNAYAFMHIDKDYLNGNKVKIYWRWYLDWSQVSYTLAYVYIVNNVNNRKLEGTGEFSTYNDIEHPVADYTYITACSLTATCNGGWISWTPSLSNTLNLNGWNSDVTIMIKIVDPWIADTVGLEVDYLQILDSSNNVLRQYDFNGNVCMDKTGGYYDYGSLRKPSSTLYGTTNYEGMGAPSWECETSEDISEVIYGFFYDTSKYNGYLWDFWGDNTENYMVCYYTDTCETYCDYSAVFYKGHIRIYGDWCNHPSCTLDHWGVWNDGGHPDDAIADFYIDDEVIDAIDDNDKFAGTHDFIFIWACGHADECRVGVFDEDHSSGLLASWMHLDPSTLDDDGYHGTPDYSDHVFIGFEWLSKWYRDLASDPNFNYGHWVYYFYYYLLSQGYTVHDALDQASRNTHYNNNYDNCPLDNGYMAWNPQDQEDQPSRMRIWGDGSHRLPR